MIFVPCTDGVSHNELEDATQADAPGANALMHTVLALAGVALTNGGFLATGYLSMPMNRLRLCFERLAKPGDPKVAIHRDPDIRGSIPGILNGAEIAIVDHTALADRHRAEMLWLKQSYS